MQIFSTFFFSAIIGIAIDYVRTEFLLVEIDDVEAKEPKCKGDLVNSKCQGHCILRCVDGEMKMDLACVYDICIPGCICPPGLYRDGLKCRKKEECLLIPKDVNATQNPKMGTQCTESHEECPHDTCNYGYCKNGCASSACTKIACDDYNKDENQLCSLKKSNCKDGLKCVDQEDGCDNGIGKCVKSSLLEN